MRYLLLLISFNCFADYEIGVSHLRINQNLFDTISFPMDAIQIDGTYWHESGFGARILIARSTETANSLFLEGKHYTNKINAMYGGEILYRQKIGLFGFEAGIGKNDYKSTWRMNGVKPSWSEGTDSDYRYHAGLTYSISECVDMRISYDDIYRKDKKGYGREETKAYSFGFVYKF